MKILSYKVRNIKFMVTAYGCLVDCDDWEAVKKDGFCSDLFARGFGGRYFATAAFKKETGFVSQKGC